MVGIFRIQTLLNLAKRVPAGGVSGHHQLNGSKRASVLQHLPSRTFSHTSAKVSRNADVIPACARVGAG